MIINVVYKKSIEQWATLGLTWYLLTLNITPNIHRIFQAWIKILNYTIPDSIGKVDKLCELFLFIFFKINLDLYGPHVLFLLPILVFSGVPQPLTCQYLVIGRHSRNWPQLFSLGALHHLKQYSGSGTLILFGDILLGTLPQIIGSFLGLGIYSLAVCLIWK